MNTPTILTRAAFIELVNDGQWRHHAELKSHCHLTRELDDGDMEFHGEAEVFSHHDPVGAGDGLCLLYTERYTFRLLTAGSLIVNTGRLHLDRVHVMGPDGELLSEADKAALMPPAFRATDFTLIEAALAGNTAAA